MGHGFHTRLGCGVDGVGRLIEPDHAGGEADDPSAATETLSCFTHAVEYALQVNRDLAIDQFVAGLGDRREEHDSGVVDEHVYATEFLLRRVEQASYGDWIAHIGLGPHCPAPG